MIAGNIPVNAFWQISRRYFIAGCKYFSMVAKIPACFQGLNIRVSNILFFSKLFVDEVDGIIHRLIKHPEEEAKDKHVLGALNLLHAQAGACEAFLGKFGNVYFMNNIIIQGAIFQWVSAIRIACKAQVLFVETSSIGNNDTAFFQRGEDLLLRLQSS